MPLPLPLHPKDMLPVLKDLLSSRFEGYVTTSLRYLKLLLQSFTQLILETRHISDSE